MIVTIVSGVTCFAVVVAMIDIVVSVVGSGDAAPEAEGLLGWVLERPNARLSRICVRC